MPYWLDWDQLLIVPSPCPLFCIASLHCWVILRDTSHLQYIATFNIAWFLCRLCFSIVVFWCQLNSLACVRMHMYHFHRYTHTALSAAYGTVYTCPMGRLQRWCMYLVVCDAVLVIIRTTILLLNKCHTGKFQCSTVQVHILCPFQFILTSGPILIAKNYQ